MWAIIRFNPVHVKEEDPDLPDVPSRYERARFLSKFEVELDLPLSSIEDHQQTNKLRLFYSQTCQEQVAEFDLTCRSSMQLRKVDWGSVKIPSAHQKSNNLRLRIYTYIVRDY